MNSAANDSNSRERRHFTPEQKVTIVKRHLVEGVPISDLCDECQIQPTQFYQWQKQLFDNAALGLRTQRQSPRSDTPGAQDRAARSQAGCQERSEISELMEECVHLKKLDGALTAKLSGLAAPDTRDEVVDYLRAWSRRTGVPLKRSVNWTRSSA